MAPRGLGSKPAAVAAALLAVWAAGVSAAAPDLSPTALRSLYVQHCAGCHALDGSGHSSAGVPSMRGNLGNFLRLPEGRAFLVQVPGVLNAGLNDAQVAALTNWQVRQFSADSAPADWPPYTADEVAVARRQRPADIAGARAALVERLRGMGHELAP